MSGSYPVVHFFLALTGRRSRMKCLCDRRAAIDFTDAFMCIFGFVSIPTIELVDISPSVALEMIYPLGLMD